MCKNGAVSSCSCMSFSSLLLIRFSGSCSGGLCFDYHPESGETAITEPFAIAVAAVFIFCGRRAPAHPRNVGGFLSTCEPDLFSTLTLPGFNPSQDMVLNVDSFKLFLKASGTDPPHLRALTHLRMLEKRCKRYSSDKFLVTPFPGTLHTPTHVPAALAFHPSPPCLDVNLADNATCDQSDRPSSIGGEPKKSHHLPGSGFLHSIADSMRESAGVQRHDAPKPAAQLPEGEASEPGTVDKIKTSISGVAGASQTMGWGAQGDKKLVKVEGTGAAPSVEAGDVGVDVDVDVSAPTVDVDLSASAPAVEGTVDVPSAEGDLTLPSGSADISGELCNFANYFFL